jgi:hypothetical protein
MQTKIIAVTTRSKKRLIDRHLQFLIDSFDSESLNDAIESVKIQLHEAIDEGKL